MFLKIVLNSPIKFEKSWTYSNSQHNRKFKNIVIQFKIEYFQLNDNRNQKHLNVTNIFNSKQLTPATNALI